MKKKLLVYSHDTYGLGNLQRMSSICRYLAEHIPQLSILLVSGSPMAHSFRMWPDVDYIKLPCLTRVGTEGYTPKFLALGINETIKLRADLILSAVTNFQPDLLLIDKKPFGVKNELAPALQFIHKKLRHTKLALILRDILDTPEVTTRIWHRHGYFQAIADFYAQVLVMGVPEIFDPRSEYDFPASVAEKVLFCGYTRRESGRRSTEDIRSELGLADNERLIVVTAGGGEDGYELIANYLAAVRDISESERLFSLIVSGPEMHAEQRQFIQQDITQTPRAKCIEFTDDLMSYFNAAEIIVAMSGYNTVCEILTLQRRAVLVPRVRPVQEQLIRAERIAALGLVRYVHPDQLTPENMRSALIDQLHRHQDSITDQINLDALPNIAAWVKAALT
ncbi:MAG TPA: glycosyltransferase [Blastocatellia bacterium]|nr:glycosyltransferase [Blastocatellia bacterium]